MSFLEAVRLSSTYLREQGRVSLVALRKEFRLDDDSLSELVYELVEVLGVASQEGAVLVSSTSSNPEPTATGARVAESGLTLDGEKRQLTVMFSDLVGSTELAERLGAEDLRYCVRAYQQMCNQALRRHGGHVAQYLGDGLLVYFGYPHAREDDAIRALHASLAILDLLPGLNATLQSTVGAVSEQPLRVRIGVHTGSVVVGEMGDSEKSEPIAVGETVNVASRIQALAEPDTVLVTGETGKLTEGYFQLEPAGRREVRGIERSIETYRVERAPGRLGHLVAKDLTPLVGRAEELAELSDRWQRAKKGSGQVVLLNGDPGIGKSRLVRALREHLADEDPLWLAGHCSPYYENSAFYPVIDVIRKGLGFEPHNDAQVRSEKLEGGLQSADLSLDLNLPLFSELLALPMDRRRKARSQDDQLFGASPESRRRQTLEAIVRWVIAVSKKQPIVLVLEDLHWVDPSSLELLGLLIDRAPSLALMLILTFRDEFEAPWSSGGSLVQWRLGPLPRSEIEVMLSHISGAHALPGAVHAQVVEKTDGVPLFVEELTKSVLESDWFQQGAREPRDGDLPGGFAIPATLQDSLTARLDRLGPARELAQLASLLGREFSYSLLSSVAEWDAELVAEQIDQLVEAELIYPRGSPGTRNYSFKHALVRDTAYQSMLDRSRKHYHRRIAEVLERDFPEVFAAEPEYAAYHYEEGGALELAVRELTRAGEAALQTSANEEAIRHFRKATELTLLQPEGAARDARELLLQVALGAPLVAARGYGNREVHSVYDRARELCQVGGATSEFPKVLFGLASFYIVAGDQREALGIGEQLLELPSGTSYREQKVFGHLATGVAKYFLGDQVSCRSHLEETIRVVGPFADPRLAYGFGQDPGVAARAYGSLARWHLGYPDQALRLSEEAIALGRASKHAFSLAFALALGAMLCGMRLEKERALGHADEAMALSEEQGFPLFLGLARVIRGWGLSDPGRGLGGLKELELALAQVAASGTKVGAPFFLSLYVQEILAAGPPDHARSVLELGFSLSERHHERFWDSELHRLSGELLVAEGGAREEEVQGHFQKAQDIAAGQSARALELRAAVSAARHLKASGRTRQARERIAPILSWFKEGETTADLLAARDVLPG